MRAAGGFFPRLAGPGKDRSRSGGGRHLVEEAGHLGQSAVGCDLGEGHAAGEHGSAGLNHRIGVARIPGS